MTLEEKALAVKNLYNNPDFVAIILDDFVNQGILDITLRDDVSSTAVQAQLKARKILIDYLYDIINQADIAKIEDEGQ